MKLPTDQEIKNALWERAHSDLAGDTIRDLYAAAIDANSPQDDDDYDDLFDAVTERFHEVMT